MIPHTIPFRLTHFSFRRETIQSRLLLHVTRVTKQTQSYSANTIPHLHMPLSIADPNVDRQVDLTGTSFQFHHDSGRFRH